jgi:iron complex outermembrane recepter protein
VIRPFVLILALLLAPVALAQTGTVTGRVVDADTDGAIPAATAALWQADALVAGAVTGPDGTFRISGIAAGRYDVVVSFVGYEEIRREGVDVGGRTLDLGTIALRPDVAELDAVEVTARRQAVEHRIDRTVYTTADDPALAGGTATDVLETIPSVDVDFDGNVSLRGSGAVAIFINGRPAPVPADLVADYLRQLPADAIDRIEVIPNPSARFEPDGTAGVLNIVLREDTDPGLGGSLALTADSRGSVNTSNLLSYGRGPWTLAGTYSFRRGLRTAEGTSFRINRFAEPLTLRDETGLDDRTTTLHNVGLSADYALARRTTLTASANLRTWAQEEERRLATRFLDGGQAPIGASERLVADDEDRIGGDLRLGFRHAFAGDNTHRLDAEGRVDMQVRERLEFIEEWPTAGGSLFEEQQTRLDRVDRRAAFDLDYVRALLGFRVETGYNFFVRLQHRDYLSQSRPDPGSPLTIDEGLTNESDYGLWIHALYGQAARELGPVGVQLGLRLESATTDVHLANTDETFRNAYASAFPSAFVSYELTENDRLRASYSRRVHRPRTDHLNPFPRFDDPLNVYVGNPEVRPSYINSFELGYARFLPWGSLTLTPYARHATDVIRYFVTMREDGVAVRTVGNIATSTSYGVESVLSFETADEALRGHLSAEGFRVMTEGAAAGTSLQNDAFGWGGRLNLTYALDGLGIAGAVVQASARYRASMRTEQGRTSGSLFTNLALRQRFLDDRLSLNLRVRDPLGMARWAYVVDEPALYQEVSRNWGARSVQLSLAFRFNQPEQRRDRDRPPADDAEFEGPPI